MNVLKKNDIKVYRGCSGDVLQLVEGFLKGKIADWGEDCHHHKEHEGEHVCNHL